MESKEFYENRKKKLEQTLSEKKTQLSDLTSGKKTLRSIFTKGDANQQKEKLSNDISLVYQINAYSSYIIDEHDHLHYFSLSKKSRTPHS